LRALESHAWPGNVRELENVVHRAAIMAKGDYILLTDLPAEVLRGGTPKPAEPSAAAPAAPVAATPEAAVNEAARVLFENARRQSQLKIIPWVERELIRRALTDTNGNQVQAAKLLGITRATLRKRMEKFSIKKELNVS
jgi:two-component system nitrogen regulation response regulator GlnG